MTVLRYWSVLTFWVYSHFFGNSSSSIGSFRCSDESGCGFYKRS